MQYIIKSPNNDLGSSTVYSLNRYVDLTMDNQGYAASEYLPILHPGIAILACIVGYDYKIVYGNDHLEKAWYYKLDNYNNILGKGDPENTYRVYYTILYKEL